MTKEELNKFPNPWIKIGIRLDTSSYIPGSTEMYIVDYSENYHGCVKGYSPGDHYDLGFLDIDAKNGYTIIING